MKSKIIFGLVFLLLIGIVTATMINYVSNNMITKVNIKTECNDLIDNDGDLLIDLADPDCSNICNKENDSTFNCL